MATEIYLQETDEPEVAVTQKNTATGVVEAATGLTLTVLYSATKTGTAIHATMSKTMTERTSTPGTYFAQILGSDKLAQLATYVDQTIYRRITNAGVDIDRVTPLTVRQSGAL